MLIQFKRQSEIWTAFKVRVDPGQTIPGQTIRNINRDQYYQAVYQFCLLIILANSLDPDHARQKSGLIWNQTV